MLFSKALQGGFSNAGIRYEPPLHSQIHPGAADCSGNSHASGVRHAGSFRHEPPALALCGGHRPGGIERPPGKSPLCGHARPGAGLRVHLLRSLRRGGLLAAGLRRRHHESAHRRQGNGPGLLLDGRSPPEGAHGRHPQGAAHAGIRQPLLPHRPGPSRGKPPRPQRWDETMVHENRW